MIPVPRSSQPRVLIRNASRWLAELNILISSHTSTEQQIKIAIGKYRNIKIKEALAGMFYGKCAYCESKITVVTYGAIEHFHPKGDPRYMHLAFEWTNLLLSCDICNDGGHKGSKFPLNPSGNPLLIDPTDGITDLNLHLEFSWDTVSGLASVYGRDERGKSVEEIFDLNGTRGRKELITYRSSYVKQLLTLLRFAQAGDLEAIELLEEACKPNSQYSAFALIHIRPHIP